MDQQSEILHGIVEAMGEVSQEERRLIKVREVLPPSGETLARVIDVVKSVLFPGFFSIETTSHMRHYFVGVSIDHLYNMLREQIARALQFNANSRNRDMAEEADSLALKFLQSLPEIKRLICTDVQAIADNDPAVVNFEEVISCYPVINAMIHYRSAHQLLRLGVPVIPRIITELAHSATGIDIHPGAKIGEYFAIDHGTGVVIGETCEIGDHVTLYQGVTLGARNFSYDGEGHPMNLPRHPIIEDYVTIYSNSTLLGRITIGHHTVVGGNVWLTHGTAPYSRILQSRATTQTFTDGLGI